ncbi:hypothetical protein J1614_011315 [Plenodomus biglobosus]|nr:hypothetical protein J1614_011315 [Plenodomus biglobosus]
MIDLGAKIRCKRKEQTIRQCTAHAFIHQGPSGEGFSSNPHLSVWAPSSAPYLRDLVARFRIPSWDTWLGFERPTCSVFPNWTRAFNR